MPDGTASRRGTLLYWTGWDMPCRRCWKPTSSNTRASSVGFDWQRIEQLLEKVSEERDELRQALAEAAPERRHQRCQEEVGDLLFVAVNVARFLGLEPESALRRTNNKFRRRFGWLEARLAERGKKPAEATLEEMEQLWQRSKSEAPR